MKETIRTLREKNLQSQSAIAEYLNISRQMYLKYESGETEPPVKVIVQLAKLYKVPYETIIDNKYAVQDNQSCYEINDSQTNSFRTIPNLLSLSRNSLINNEHFVPEQIRILNRRTEKYRRNINQLTFINE